MLNVQSSKMEALSLNKLIITYPSLLNPYAFIHSNQQYEWFD